MSKSKDNITKQIEMIDKAIKDEDEKKVVFHALKEIIAEFTTHLLTLQRRVEIGESRLHDVESIVAEMQDYVYDDSNEDDLFGNCPYCGEEIPIIFKDDNYADIECPNCHNMIEIEMMYNDNFEDSQSNFGKIINFEEFKKELSSFNKSKKNNKKKK